MLSSVMPQLALRAKHVSAGPHCSGRRESRFVLGLQAIRSTDSTERTTDMRRPPVDDLSAMKALESRCCDRNREKEPFFIDVE